MVKIMAKETEPIVEADPLDLVTREKLIILMLTYRAQVEYLLDNFVSTENVTTEFWMDIMDRYAAKQIKHDVE